MSFFRTIEDRLAIFAEYVEGGILRDWIRERKLLTLNKILDVSIQCAWGLHFAHEQGVIHQDMKPANVLMTKDGTAKITDFGLARGLHSGGISMPAGTKPKSMLVSSLGMTEAYCSPEQYDWEKLTFRSDIWSWGLSVFEMFTGSVTWGHGTIAKEALESFLEKGAHNPPYPPMSKDIAEVLMRCFRKVPEERWESLDEAADSLQEIYKKETGKKYHRKKPTAKESSEAPGVSHDRRIQSGMKWDDPMKWLEKALKAAGRDLSELERTAQKRKGSRKSQALIDLEVYERAQDIYFELLKKGTKYVENDLPELLANKAFVHSSLDDVPGEIVTYDLSIEILKRLVKRHKELADHLAVAYMNKGNAVRSLGDNSGAMKLYDKAIAIRKRLVKKGDTKLAEGLAETYMSQANAVGDSGNNLGAMKLYDKAIAILEKLVNKGHKELAEALSRTYLNKANDVSLSGDNKGAIELHDKAIAILERLVYKEDRKDLASALAMAYRNKVVDVSSLFDNHTALELCNRAIAIQETMVGFAR